MDNNVFTVKNLSFAFNDMNKSMLLQGAYVSDHCTAFKSYIFSPLGYIGFFKLHKSCQKIILCSR